MEHFFDTVRGNIEFPAQVYRILERNRSFLSLGVKIRMYILI